jgi:hypothetical protein
VLGRTHTSALTPPPARLEKVDTDRRSRSPPMVVVVVMSSCSHWKATTRFNNSKPPPQPPVSHDSRETNGVRFRDRSPQQARPCCHPAAGFQVDNPLGLGRRGRSTLVPFTSRHRWSGPIAIVVQISSFPCPHSRSLVRLR